MTKRAVEHTFDGATTPYTSYDSTKTNLGKLIIQKLDSDGNSFAGPIPVGITRPLEQAFITISGSCVSAIPFSSTVDWVFVGDGTAAAATRQLTMYTFDRTTSTFDYQGYITLTFPAGVGTNKTTTAIEAIRTVHSLGAVTVSGTTVTGNGTEWQTNRLAAGARIGFGSSDPTKITSWYEIAAIGSETSITLAANAGTIPVSDYVIEELRILYAVTTSLKGGLMVVKGLHPGSFTATGNTIPAAVSTDNVRAVYWLTDYAIDTDGVCGLAVLEQSPTSQIVYVLNRVTTSTVGVFSFNVRAALTVSSGESSSAYNFRTNDSPVLTYNPIATVNNGSWCPVSRRFWFVSGTSTPGLNYIQESNISNLSDPSPVQLNEATPFLNTFLAEGASYVDVRVLCDIGQVLITGIKSYCISASSPLANKGVHAALCLDFHSNQASSTPFNSQPHLDRTPIATSLHTAYQNGMAYVLRAATNTTAFAHHLYAIPLGVQWDYASGQGNATNQERLITPSIATPDAEKLLRVYVNHPEIYGSEHLGVPAEPIRVYARTSGITDDSGVWQPILGGDLTKITPTSEIQIMIEFRIFGITPLPAKIYGISVVYEDASTDSHFIPSAHLSNTSENQFVWKFRSRFHQPFPTLRVLLQNATTDEVLVDDSTVFPGGLFEKSTDNGQNWTVWNTDEPTNDITYIRYTARALAPEILVAAKLSTIVYPVGGLSCSGGAYWWTSNEQMYGGVRMSGNAEVSQSEPRCTFGGIALNGTARVIWNRENVSGGIISSGQADAWGNPEKMSGGIGLHGRCDEGIIRDILFVEGDKQDVLMKIPSIAPTNIDDIVVGPALDTTFVHSAGGTLIMNTTGTLNAADDIVAELGSITMIIPSGTVNEPLDILLDGDIDQLLETELISVPNVVVSSSRRVR